MSQRWRSRVGWFVLLALLLAACASKASSPVESMPAEIPPVEKGIAGGVIPPADMEKVAPAPGMDVARSAPVQNTVPGTERLVIYNANLTLTVDDPQTSAQRIAQLAEQMGGYVVSMETYTVGPAGAQEEQATITVRVPATRYRETLNRITALAVRVDHRTESSQDVTEEYVDLDARLRNLKAAESQLQEIMNQATRTEDVLQVYRELVRIREEIEVLEGRKRYLEQSAAMARITVTLQQRKAATPVSSGGWEPQGVLKDALQALLTTLQWLATAAIWLVLYILPLALLLGGIIWPLYVLIRRRRRQ